MRDLNVQKFLGFGFEHLNANVETIFNLQIALKPVARSNGLRSTTQPVPAA